MSYTITSLETWTFSIIACCIYILVYSHSLYVYIFVDGHTAFQLLRFTFLAFEVLAAGVRNGGKSRKEHPGHMKLMKRCFFLGR